MEIVLTVSIPILFVVFFALERLFPARPLPKVRWWALKGFAFFVVSGAINMLLPAALATLLDGKSPLRLEALGPAFGAIVAFVVSDFFAYWTHRGLHRWHFVWRWTHQMHHSAERLDIPGAVYFHPFDLAIQVAAVSVPIILLGVSADAAALAGFIGFVYGMFQHLNVKTPRWLGYVLQRPEQHAIHHARGVHAYNYGNVPLWDLLFGTFRNPASFPAEPQGFWDGASARMGAMLLGRDVAEQNADTARAPELQPAE